MQDQLAMPDSQAKAPSSWKSPSRRRRLPPSHGPRRLRWSGRTRASATIPRRRTFDHRWGGSAYRMWSQHTRPRPTLKNSFDMVGTDRAFKLWLWRSLGTVAHTAAPCEVEPHTTISYLSTVRRSCHRYFAVGAAQRASSTYAVDAWIVDSVQRREPLRECMGRYRYYLRPGKDNT